MKRNWLLYLVIFSLALNLGTIGTLVYLRYQAQQPAAQQEPPPPLPLRGLWGPLNLDPAQSQALRDLIPAHRRRVMEARRELAEKRQELFDLVKREAASWSEVQAKVREISTLQGGLEEEIARFLLEVKKNLKPEQHTAFVDLMQRRMGRACGPMGGPPPGRGRGMGPGPGMGKGMGPGMGKGPMGPSGPPEER